MKIAWFQLLIPRILQGGSLVSAGNDWRDLCLAQDMSSSVIVRLKDGTMVAVLDDVDQPVADALRANLHRWTKNGDAIEITHASGDVDEIQSLAVDTIEVIEVVGRLGAEHQERRTG
jgi:hypothetical protein